MRLMQRGEPIPDTWLIGPDGRPTTDGRLYPQRASLAPMAGHKGYGLACGAKSSPRCCPGARDLAGRELDLRRAGRPSRHNASFIAIDVAAIAPAEQFE